MIPKRIFYVWGADEPKRRDVELCILTWRQVMPDFEIIEINEKSTTFFDFKKELKNNLWFREVYRRKIWACVADYIRIKVLFEHGGVYFDTDVSALKSLMPFLDDKCFVGMQKNAEESSYDYVEPAILGAQKGNPILGKILKIYEGDIFKLPIYSMPQIFDYVLRQTYQDKFAFFGAREKQKILTYDDITIYPERYFIPFEDNEKFSFECISNDTHTIHWWGSSWTRPEILFFLKHKHMYSLKELSKMTPEERWKARFCLFGLPIFPLSYQNDIYQIFGLNLLRIQKRGVDKNKKYTPVLELKLFDKIPLLKIEEKHNQSAKKMVIFGLPIFMIKKKREM